MFYIELFKTISLLCKILLMFIFISNFILRSISKFKIDNYKLLTKRIKIKH